jgi:hypothetical protein
MLKSRIWEKDIITIEVDFRNVGDKRRGTWRWKLLFIYFKTNVCSSLLK